MLLKLIYNPFSPLFRQLRPDRELILSSTVLFQYLFNRNKCQSLKKDKRTKEKEKNRYSVEKIERDRDERDEKKRNKK